MISDRFSRQEKLIDQRKIENLKVCVVGLGGLGSIVSLYLAYLGVKNLILIDNDKVDVTNLNRQILYNLNDVGKYKVEVAAKKLKEVDPDLNIKVFKNVNDIYGIDCDYIFDCLDSWKYKILLDNIAHKKKSILIHAGVKGFLGQIYLHIPNVNPCITQVFKVFPKDSESFQIVGPTCGIVGSFMVQLMILHLLGYEVWKWVYLYRYDKIEKARISNSKYAQD